MSNHESTFRSELHVIPGWAKVLAVAFAICMFLFLSFVFAREPQPPPLAFRVSISVLASVVLGVFVLLVGYVNRDAGRRGMSRAAWTLIVIFVPNALGFILYFLLRKPLQGNCPRCGAEVRPDYNFCPRCDHKLAPTCPACNRAVRPGDAFCAHCGASLKAGEQALRE